MTAPVGSHFNLTPVPPDDIPRRSRAAILVRGAEKALSQLVVSRGFTCGSDSDDEGGILQTLSAPLAASLGGIGDCTERLLNYERESRLEERQRQEEQKDRQLRRDVTVAEQRRADEELALREKEGRLADGLAREDLALRARQIDLCAAAWFRAIDRDAEIRLRAIEVEEHRVHFLKRCQEDKEKRWKLALITGLPLSVVEPDLAALPMSPSAFPLPAASSLPRVSKGERRNAPLIVESAPLRPRVEIEEIPPGRGDANRNEVGLPLHDRRLHRGQVSVVGEGRSYRPIEPANQLLQGLTLRQLLSGRDVPPEVARIVGRELNNGLRYYAVLKRFNLSETPRILQAWIASTEKKEEIPEIHFALFVGREVVSVHQEHAARIAILEQLCQQYQNK